MEVRPPSASGKVTKILVIIFVVRARLPLVYIYFRHEAQFKAIVRWHTRWRHWNFTPVIPREDWVVGYP